MAIEKLKTIGLGGSAPQGLGGFADQSKTAMVMHGHYAESLPVAGMTVAEIRNKFRDRLDIAPDALAFISASQVSDDIIVKAGQVLMFSQEAGEKGA